MDPKNPQDPNSPWYQNEDWQPPDDFKYGGYQWNNGQPTKIETDPSTGNTGPYHDINYWQNQGVGYGDIFDTSTGQIKPGWLRTGTGYEKDPNYKPPTSGGTNTGGNNPLLPPGSIGSLLKPFDQAPPDYTDPRYPAAPSFPNIPTWQSPTGKEAEELPGYKFARDQGLEALQNSAAARGVTNTGGTLEDIVKFGDQFAGQNYQTARSNSLEDYQNNVASKFLLPYQAAYNTWSVQNPQAGLDAQNKNNFNWNNYLQGYNIFRNQGNDTYNRLFGLAQLGSGVQ